MTNADSIESRSSFSVPADFDAAKRLRRAWGLADQELVEVRLLVTEATAIKRIPESRWHPSQNLDNPRGIEVRFRVGDLIEITPWIVSWGSAVEVLAPAELRDRVAAIARGMVERHASATSMPVTA